ncbi:MAG: response regulator [Chitinophagaceae bacterium]|nr:MAG: response regulator [Chitinophagaceae bacterium]
MQKHILIIDDNKDLLTMLTAMLKTRGYQVSVSETAEAILDRVKEVKPDLIMMDMLLSGADGRDVCRLIKGDEAIAAIPLLMLSAYPQAVDDCLAAGADGFVEKPFDMKVLLSKLSSLHG